MAVDVSAPARSEPAAPSDGLRPEARRLLIGILVLGAALRFSTISEQSFWFDEASTYGVVAHGFGHVLPAVAKTESTPPLYYLLLWLWSQVLGTGEAGLRSLSAVCGTATIAVMWMLGRRLVSERAGLLAALLTAVNPLLFWYSQEARSYALLLLVSALSLLAFARACEAPSERRLLIWGVSAAVALNVHYFAVFLLVPAGLALLALLRRTGRLTWRRTAITAGPAAIFAIPLGILALHQNDGRANYIAESGSLPYRLAQLVKQNLIGQGQPAKVLLGAVGSVVVLLALVLLIRRGSPRERSVLWLGAIGAAGVALAVLIAAVGTDYFNTRNMLPTWPAFALVVAAGLAARRGIAPGSGGAALLTVLSLFCIATVITNPDYQRDNWRGAAQALGPATDPRAIIADRYVSNVPLQVYLQHLHAYPAAGTRLREVDILYIERPSLGQDVRPVKAVPLPGFTYVAHRTSSYVVIRYRARRAVLESAATLDRIYPDPLRVRALLQP